ncbi:MAG TPA: M56 family metallopeptidase, partial [Flavobacterium sp.]|nr:M56 family metallopeptidase [Flavobacterium sp.]
MITYLLKSGLLLAVFFAVYKLLLENEKMFRFNRIYLLGSIFFSLIIPLQLFSVVSLFSDKVRMIQLQEIMIVTDKAVLDKVDYSEILMYFFGIIYSIIATILIVRFIQNVLSFYFSMKKNRIEIIKGQKVVLTEERILPHSFWNAIFLNQEDFKNGKIPLELLTHEKAHLKQKHTLDILFIEILQIVFWFNPIFIWYKKAIKLNHEFLADEAVNKQFGEVKNYQNLLLDFASQKNTVALASTINYLITKKRLLMMTKEESVTKIVLKVFTVCAVYAITFFVFTPESIAQSSNNVKMKEGFNLSYDTTNASEPKFPGGIEKFYMFVGQNFKIPEEFAKQKADGKIFMEFMIEKDGSLSDFKVA